MTIKHPIQPPVVDKNGHVRFKENPIINWMLEKGEKGEKFDLITIARQGFDRVHYDQFNQLIGYSLSAYPGSEDIRSIAFAMYDSGKSEQDTKIEYYEKKISDIKDGLRVVFEDAFDGYEDLEAEEQP